MMRLLEVYRVRVDRKRLGWGWVQEESKKGWESRGWDEGLKTGVHWRD